MSMRTSSFLDQVADVVSVLLDVARDPRIDRGRLERLERPRLDDRHPDVALLGPHDPDPRGAPFLALGRGAFRSGRTLAPVGVLAAGGEQEASGARRVRALRAVVGLLDGCHARAIEDPLTRPSADLSPRGEVEETKIFSHSADVGIACNLGLVLRLLSVSAGDLRGRRHRQCPSRCWAARGRASGRWGHSGYSPGRPGRARAIGSRHCPATA